MDSTLRSIKEDAKMEKNNCKVESMVETFDGEMINALSATMNKTPEEVLEWLMATKRESILKQHKEQWTWWQNSKGRWVTYVPDPTKKEGRKQISAKEEKDLETKVVNFYKNNGTDNRTLTLRILYPEWLNNKKADKTIKAGTIHRNETDWLRYYEGEEIIDKPLGLLTGDMLQDWMLSKVEQFQMGKHQYGNFSSIIKQMMEYATDKKYLEYNPYKGVHINRKKNLYIEESKPKNKLVFNRDEQKDIIQYCWTQYANNSQIVQKFVPLAIVFCFYTGLRAGELAAVKFSDIVNGELTVQRMVEYDSREVVAKVKKGTKKRYIPLTSEAMDVIEEIRRRREKMGLSTDSYIFTVNEPIKVYVRIQAMLRVYCKALGMVERSPHDIRRTFISNLLDAGVDIKTVMELAGHEQSSTTYNHYAYSVRKKEERKKVIQNALGY